MNNIIKFLDIHYENALKLVSDFDITKSKAWDPQIYLNELYVQLGHVYNVLFANENVNETKRKIDNLGDELSDVLLQLINLAKIMNIDMYEIKKYEDYDYHDISGISILLGQLTEAIMENNDCRFKKDRVGFDTSYDFVKDRLFKLFIITYNISLDYKLDIIKEFDDMLKDANGFLDRFRKGNNKVHEYIDIYDSKENLLGYCEKTKAHKLGYWHRVIGCLIYNRNQNKVFMQLKNPKHNKIHKKPLLEITVGGHLISGETLINGVREIKEETGFVVDYKQLVFLERRVCDESINKKYKVNEFQYYYSLNLDIKVEDFSNYDKDEVLGFVEFDIEDLIKLINGKLKSVKGKRETGEIINIKVDDLDNAFIKNGLYLSLLTKLDTKKEVSSMRSKIKKLYKEINHEKKINPEKFYFDNGNVCESKDYEKAEIKYSVMKVNTDVNTDNYLVYLLVIAGNKIIPQMLLKKFTNNKDTTKYFNELCNLVEQNTNQDIINKCYKNKFPNVLKPNLISRILGL